LRHRQGNHWFKRKRPSKIRRALILSVTLYQGVVVAAGAAGATLVAAGGSTGVAGAVALAAGGSVATDGVVVLAAGGVTFVVF
jgi:hypothetical protein